ncbi:WxL domain-containing protein, partial [Pseudomonas aeruginosa]|nr:WxL domain-containing protein [Pseudomonas aeruginosa]
VEAAQVASIQSNADITFALDNTVTPPVNPTNPSQPVTPNPADPHQPGTAGPLSIDYVSNIHFGSKQIQAGTAIYSAQLDQVQNSTGDLISVPNYVQVTDKRGLNLGWKLSVKQSAQFATSDSTPAVLDNASLTFLAATPNSTQLLSLAPLTVPVTLDPTLVPPLLLWRLPLFQQEWALGH